MKFYSKSVMGFFLNVHESKLGIDLILRAIKGKIKTLLKLLNVNC